VQPNVEQMLILFFGYRGVVHPPSDDEPGLSPNNSLENAFLSDQSMQAIPARGKQYVLLFCCFFFFGLQGNCPPSVR